MRLREPHAADYSTVFSWLPTADEDAYRVWAGPRMPFPPRLESFAQDLWVQNEFSFVLEAEMGEVVGFGQILLKADDHAHLIHLIVDPERRRRGYGKQLVRLFMAEAKARWRSRRFSLNVSSTNSAAIRLYRRLGFSPDTPHEDSVPRGGSVCMTRLA